MICRFGGCGKPAPCRGLCPGHYQQQRNGQALRPLHQKRALLPNPDMPGTLLVPLTRGMFAIIDERDGPAVGARNWHAITSKISRAAYAGANVTPRSWRTERNKFSVNFKRPKKLRSPTAQPQKSSMANSPETS